jgi:hypothetical protein
MRYIEVVGGVGIWYVELNDGEPLTGYTGLNRGVMEIGEFTRENIARFLEVRLGPEAFPVEDFHAVCDDVEIPWATEKGRDDYRHITELAAAKGNRLGG